MSGPNHPVRRTWGKGALLALAAVVAAASAARSAEVAIAEVEGTANHVTVEQGGMAWFTLEFRASGWIRCATSPSNPATAAIDRDITIGTSGSPVGGGTLETASFYAEPNGGSLCRVTWDDDPDPQRIQMRVTADLEAPLGDHVYFPRLTLSTPPGSGDRLEDRQRTSLRFTVVPGSDRTPPEVACSGPNGELGRNGWYVSAVSHACVAADHGSGLGDAGDASFTLATSEQGTALTDARVVADRAGNETPAGPFGPYTVDTTDPIVDVTVPTEGHALVLGSDASASFACHDGVSGIAACEASVLDTGTVGTKTFTARAMDGAGRETIVTRTYHVVYGFSWASSPSGSAKAGSAIPVRWSLGGVADPASFVAVASVPCGGGANEPAATVGAGPTYAKGADAFHVVIKSDRSWRGCRTLLVALDDGTMHKFDVAFS